MQNPMYNLTPEQRVLFELAKKTWEQRERAKRLEMNLGEETLTENLLMDIADEYPGTVLIQHFNKRREAATGADWAWAFVNSTEDSITPMFVQAKILDRKDKNYQELDRLVGAKPQKGPDNRRRQVDVLIDGSRLYRWPALYLFYNHLSDPRRIPQNCNSLNIRIPSSWGISVAEAGNVRAALNDRSFDTHRKHSIALHCLLCSKGTGRRFARGSPEQILDAIHRLRTGESSIASSVDPVPFADMISNPLEELPELFAEAQRIDKIRSKKAKDAQLDLFAEINPNLAGVAIFKDG